MPLDIFNTNLEYDNIYEVEITGPILLTNLKRDSLTYKIRFTLEDCWSESLGDWGNIPRSELYDLAERIMQEIGDYSDNMTIEYDDYKVSGDVFQRIKAIFRNKNVSESVIKELDWRLREIQNGMIKPGFYYVDIHPDVDWSPGDYKEASGSCWWKMSNYAQGRMQFRHMCHRKKAFAFRLYKLTKNDEFEPAGRCFAAKVGRNWALFNAYGPELNTFAAIFSKMVKTPFTMSTLALNPNIFVNDEEAAVFGTSKSLRDTDWSDYDYGNLVFEEDYKEYMGNWSKGFRESGHYCSVCSTVYEEKQDMKLLSNGYTVCQECINNQRVFYTELHNRYEFNHNRGQYMICTIQQGAQIYRDTFVSHDTLWDTPRCKCGTYVSNVSSSRYYEVTCLDCLERNKHERSVKASVKESKVEIKRKGFRYEF